MIFLQTKFQPLFSEGVFRQKHVKNMPNIWRQIKVEDTAYFWVISNPILDAPRIQILRNDPPNER